MPPVFSTICGRSKNMSAAKLVSLDGLALRKNGSSNSPTQRKTASGFISIVNEQAGNHRTARRSLTDF